MNRFPSRQSLPTLYAVMMPLLIVSLVTTIMDFGYGVHHFIGYVFDAKLGKGNGKPTSTQKR